MYACKDQKSHFIILVCSLYFFYLTDKIKNVVLRVKPCLFQTIDYLTVVSFSSRCILFSKISMSDQNLLGCDAGEDQQS